LKNVCNYSQHWLQPQFWWQLCFEFEAFHRIISRGLYYVTTVLTVGLAFKPRSVRQRNFGQTDGGLGIWCRAQESRRWLMRIKKRSNWGW